jgi:hypothetical protein
LSDSKKVQFGKKKCFSAILYTAEKRSQPSTDIIQSLINYTTTKSILMKPISYSIPLIMNVMISKKKEKNAKQDHLEKIYVPSLSPSRN